MAFEPLAINCALVEAMLCRFIRQELGRIGINQAVLGLSGGVDSAVVAGLAARALGGTNVLAVMMPYKASSPASLADALAVAEAFGLRSRTIDITPQIDAYFDSNRPGDPIPVSCQEDELRNRRGNKMARERMTILYDFSMAERALVLGTSNKTELLLGYGTLFGDMASAINPIGDLYKTQIWDLARHLNVPQPVITKKPTADLWEGQTDEGQLGHQYHAIDELFYYLVDLRWSQEAVLAKGYQAEFVDKIVRLLRTSQFKRRLPVIAKISQRTIDRDFRYARDWGT